MAVRTYDDADAAELVAAAASAAPGRVCLAAVMGSHAYGLAGPSSDIDVHGVFMLSVRALCGLSSPARSWTSSKPDMSFHELGTFVVQALDGSPRSFELLFRDDLLVCDAAGAALVAARSLLLSERVRDRYRRHAVGEMTRMSASRGAERTAKAAKNSRHMLRLLRHGRQLVSTGTLELHVEDPEEYAEFAARPLEERLAVFEAELAALDAARSVLPPEPDAQAAEELVWSLRGV